MVGKLLLIIFGLTQIQWSFCQTSIFAPPKSGGATNSFNGFRAAEPSPSNPWGSLVVTPLPNQQGPASPWMSPRPTLMSPFAAPIGSPASTRPLSAPPTTHSVLAQLPFSPTPGSYPQTSAPPMSVLSPPKSNPAIPFIPPFSYPPPNPMSPAPAPNPVTPNPPPSPPQQSTVTPVTPAPKPPSRDTVTSSSPPSSQSSAKAPLDPITPGPPQPIMPVLFPYRNTHIGLERETLLVPRDPRPPSPKPQPPALPAHPREEKETLTDKLEDRDSGPLKQPTQDHGSQGTTTPSHNQDRNPYGPRPQETPIRTPTQGSAQPQGTNQGQQSSYPGSFGQGRDPYNNYRPELEENRNPYGPRPEETPIRNPTQGSSQPQGTNQGQQSSYPGSFGQERDPYKNYRPELEENRNPYGPRPQETPIRNPTQGSGQPQGTNQGQQSSYPGSFGQERDPYNNYRPELEENRNPYGPRPQETPIRNPTQGSGQPQGTNQGQQSSYPDSFRQERDPYNNYRPGLEEDRNPYGPRPQETPIRNPTQGSGQPQGTNQGQQSSYPGSGQPQGINQGQQSSYPGPGQSQGTNQGQQSSYPGSFGQERDPYNNYRPGLDEDRNPYGPRPQEIPIRNPAQGSGRPQGTNQGQQSSYPGSGQPQGTNQGQQSSYPGSGQPQGTNQGQQSSYPGSYGQETDPYKYRPGLEEDRNPYGPGPQEVPIRNPAQGYGQPQGTNQGQQPSYPGSGQPQGTNQGQQSSYPGSFGQETDPYNNYRPGLEEDRNPYGSRPQETPIRNPAQGSGQPQGTNQGQQPSYPGASGRDADQYNNYLPELEEDPYEPRPQETPIRNPAQGSGQPHSASQGQQLSYPGSFGQERDQYNNYRPELEENRNPYGPRPQETPIRNPTQGSGQPQGTNQGQQSSYPGASGRDADQYNNYRPELEEDRNPYGPRPQETPIRNPAQGSGQPHSASQGPQSSYPGSFGQERDQYNNYRPELEEDRSPYGPRPQQTPIQNPAQSSSQPHSASQGQQSSYPGSFGEGSNPYNNYPGLGEDRNPYSPRPQGTQLQTPPQDSGQSQSTNQEQKSAYPGSSERGSDPFNEYRPERQDTIPYRPQENSNQNTNYPSHEDQYASEHNDYRYNQEQQQYPRQQEDSFEEIWNDQEHSQQGEQRLNDELDEQSDHDRMDPNDMEPTDWYEDWGRYDPYYDDDFSTDDEFDEQSYNDKNNPNDMDPIDWPEDWGQYDPYYDDDFSADDEFDEQSYNDRMNPNDMEPTDWPEDWGQYDPSYDDDFSADDKFDEQSYNDRMNPNDMEPTDWPEDWDQYDPYYDDDFSNNKEFDEQSYNDRMNSNDMEPTDWPEDWDQYDPHYDDDFSNNKEFDEKSYNDRMNPNDMEPTDWPEDWGQYDPYYDDDLHNDWGQYEPYYDDEYDSWDNSYDTDDTIETGEILTRMLLINDVTIIDDDENVTPTISDDTDRIDEILTQLFISAISPAPVSDDDSLNDEDIADEIIARIFLYDEVGFEDSRTDSESDINDEVMYILDSILLLPQSAIQINPIVELEAKIKEDPTKIVSDYDDHVSALTEAKSNAKDEMKRKAFERLAETVKKTNERQKLGNEADRELSDKSDILKNEKDGETTKVIMAPSQNKNIEGKIVKKAKPEREFKKLLENNPIAEVNKGYEETASKDRKRVKEFIMKDKAETLTERSNGVFDELDETGVKINEAKTTGASESSPKEVNSTSSATVKKDKSTLKKALANLNQNLDSEDLGDKIGTPQSRAENLTILAVVNNTPHGGVDKINNESDAPQGTSANETTKRLATIQGVKMQDNEKPATKTSTSKHISEEVFMKETNEDDERSKPNISSEALEKLESKSEKMKKVNGKVQNNEDAGPGAEKIQDSENKENLIKNNAAPVEKSQETNKLAEDLDESNTVTVETDQRERASKVDEVSMVVQAEIDAVLDLNESVEVSKETKPLPVEGSTSEPVNEESEDESVRDSIGESVVDSNVLVQELPIASKEEELVETNDNQPSKMDEIEIVIATDDVAKAENMNENEEINQREVNEPSEVKQKEDDQKSTDDQASKVDEIKIVNDTPTGDGAKAENINKNQEIKQEDTNEPSKISNPSDEKQKKDDLESNDDQPSKVNEIKMVIANGDVANAENINENEEIKQREVNEPSEEKQKEEHLESNDDQPSKVNEIKIVNANVAKAENINENEEIKQREVNEPSEEKQKEDDLESNDDQPSKVNEIKIVNATGDVAKVEKITENEEIKQREVNEPSKEKQKEDGLESNYDKTSTIDENKIVDGTSGVAKVENINKPEEITQEDANEPSKISKPSDEKEKEEDLESNDDQPSKVNKIKIVIATGDVEKVEKTTENEESKQREVNEPSKEKQKEEGLESNYDKTSTIDENKIVDGTSGVAKVENINKPEKITQEDANEPSKISKPSDEKEKEEDIESNDDQPSKVNEIKIVIATGDVEKVEKTTENEKIKQRDVNEPSEENQKEEDRESNDDKPSKMDEIQIVDDTPTGGVAKVENINKNEEIKEKDENEPSKVKEINVVNATGDTAKAENINENEEVKQKDVNEPSKISKPSEDKQTEENLESNDDGPKPSKIDEIKIINATDDASKAEIINENEEIKQKDEKITKTSEESAKSDSGKSIFDILQKTVADPVLAKPLSSLTKVSSWWRPSK